MKKLFVIPIINSLSLNTTVTVSRGRDSSSNTYIKRGTPMQKVNIWVPNSQQQQGHRHTRPTLPKIWISLFPLAKLLFRLPQSEMHWNDRRIPAEETSSLQWMSGMSEQKIINKINKKKGHKVHLAINCVLCIPKTSALFCRTVTFYWGQACINQR